MAGVYSRTAQCGMKVMFAAMRLLKEQGGSCRLSVLRSLSWVNVAIFRAGSWKTWEVLSVSTISCHGIPPAMWLLASSESRGVLGI